MAKRGGRRGYYFEDFTKAGSYPRIILDSIPDTAPGGGIRWKDLFAEVQRKTNGKMSPRTLARYLYGRTRGFKLPVIAEGDPPRWRRDPKLEQIIYPLPKDAPEEWKRIVKNAVRKLRSEVPQDAWSDISGDWRKIPDLIHEAVLLYLLFLRDLLVIDHEAKARDFLELYMKLRLEPDLARAAAITWQNRAEIKRAGGMKPRVLGISIF
jgi:hypothetical protein